MSADADRGAPIFAHVETWRAFSRPENCLAPRQVLERQLQVISETRPLPALAVRGRGLQCGKILVMHRVSLKLVMLLSLAASAPTAARAADAIVLDLPLACTVGETCAIQQYVDHDPSSAARDYQCGTLTYDGHNGTDFRLPTLAVQRAGVDVLAAAPGVVLRLRSDMADVSIAERGAVALGNRLCGNGVVIAHAGGWETQYCHMAKDSVRVRPGQTVAAGDPLGRVGLSGATVFPHLHFTVRHQGQTIDPFAFAAAPESCGGGKPLWRPVLAASLTYRPRALLNWGFAAAAVSMQAIEAGEVATAGADPAAVVAWVRSIGLKSADVQELRLIAPSGEILLDHRARALERNEAQSLLFAGKTRPAGGWPAGVYRASYRVLVAGAPVLERSFALALGRPSAP
jgi:Peptidase family M23